MRTDCKYIGRENIKGFGTVKKVKWFLNRLKAMNIVEIVWRVQQKILQKIEYIMFFSVHKSIVEITLSSKLKHLRADAKRLYLNYENTRYNLFKGLELFGVYDYEDYKCKWNAGFQTDNFWPIEEFSYSIPISQREDIGDIRINWELNRHFQFVGLAKNYYITSDSRYIEELKQLFYDWNSNNKFLHGVQWTSSMEIAIRIVSWSYVYVFLSKSKCDRQFLSDIEHGIKVMSDYALKHRARYTSANNHLIVEMLGVGIAGFLFAYDKWIKKAIKILTEELPKQNYEDGVNKEMSLHYQSFVMEAYGLLWLNMKHNCVEVPVVWKQYLSNMSRFMADCCGDYGEVVVFGDNDEGKILDFTGSIKDHYRYVLQLMGCLLENRYTDSELIENIFWVVRPSDIDEYYNKELYTPGLVCVYKEGGYTIFRSKDRRVIIGFDHAELGFGSIAAHGHADALSLQAFYKGNPILLDAGTYNYHVPKQSRDEVRKSSAHNTICIAEAEQAEILGPFLWGKRFKIEKYHIEQNNDTVKVEAWCTYNGFLHKRILCFDFDREIQIKDILNTKCTGLQIWNIPKTKCALGKNLIDSEFVSLDIKGEYVLDECKYSNKYSICQDGLKISIKITAGNTKTIIKIKDK